MIARAVSHGHDTGMTDIQFHTMPDNRRIAFRHLPGSDPGIVFLPGYMSDMEGGKATALFDWCKATGRACLLLDYSGCGASDGDFAEGTLTAWHEEVLALIHAYTTGRIVLVGSSMGGWLMLLVAQALRADKLAGLVGIASAPDFSEWGYDEAQKSSLLSGETIFEESDYGYDPMPTHAKFWHDAQAQKLLEETIAITCPVRLLHGQDDTDVPPQISLRLTEVLASDDVHITLIKGGDHRLSRDSDITLLKRIVGSIA